MTSGFYRMQLAAAGEALPVPAGIIIVRYARERHHALIPHLYAQSFADDPWPTNWDAIPQFDPRGVYVAEVAATGEPAGFVVSFPLETVGYVSVLAVPQAFQRRGIGRALLQAAVDYLRSLAAVETIRVDVDIDRASAIRLYRQFGFTVLCEMKNTT